MTATFAASRPDHRLPRLAGAWLRLYRALWCVMAIAAAAILVAALFQPAIAAGILVLRTIKGGVLIAVSTILLRRRADDPVAALLSLALLTWAISSSFDITSTELLPRLLDRIRFLLFALGLLLFPDGAWRPGWTRSVAIASAGVCLLGIVESLQVLATRLFLPLAIGCVIAAVAALVVRFRSAKDESARQQLKWVALGLVGGIGLILTARAGVALGQAVASPMSLVWEALFQIGIVVIALGFLVSLLRYRLFDAEAAISRSAALAALTLALVATFAGAEAAIEWLGQQYLGTGIGNVSAAMAAALAAVLLNPLHSQISDWAERRFQRDLVLLKRDLPEILADLSASGTPAQVGSTILPLINSAVHATRSALIAPGARAVAASGTELKQVRRWTRERLDGAAVPTRIEASDALFPVRLRLRCPFSGRVGWLLLGPRPDGSLFGKDDLEALDSLLPAIRHALAWASSRQAERLRARREQRAILASLAALEARLQRAGATPATGQEIGLQPRFDRNCRCAGG